MNRKLYVGNLPYATSETDLQVLFTTAGSVQSVRVALHPETGYPRGFALVEMATVAGAIAAIGALHDIAFHGRKLSVHEASVQEHLRGSVLSSSGRRAQTAPTPTQTKRVPVPRVGGVTRSRRRATPPSAKDA